jgi:hypothetical protein
MLNNERINIINELIGTIYYIKEKSSDLYKRLKFLTFILTIDYSEKLFFEIAKIEKEYNLAIIELERFESILRAYQKKYIIEYSHKTLEESVLIELYLNTTYNIDTFSNNWENYIDNSDATEVIKEVNLYLKKRVLNYSIKNIKSL